MKRSSQLKAPATRGFTLIELLVTLGIGTVLLATGIPSFQGFMGSQRTKSAASDLHHALLLARSEAVKRNSPVSLAPAADGWSAGWLVSAGGTVLLQQGAYQGLEIEGPGAAVSYAGDGRPAGASGLTFSITGGSTSRCIAIALAGLPSNRSGSCS